MHRWLHAALALISKQAHLLVTAHAVNTVQSSVQSEWQIHIWQWLFAYRPNAAVTGYGAPVCVEYWPDLNIKCFHSKMFKQRQKFSMFNS